MSNTSVSIRIDKELKNNVESIFDDMGLNMTTAFIIFAKAVVREKRIPFEIKVSDPFFGKENVSRIKKSLKQLDAGKGKNHELIEE